MCMSFELDCSDLDYKRTTEVQAYGIIHKDLFTPSESEKNKRTKKIKGKNFKEVVRFRLCSV